jgi:hypothetical protein
MMCEDQKTRREFAILLIGNKFSRNSPPRTSSMHSQNSLTFQSEMPVMRTFILFLAIVTFAFAGCKKSEEFTNPVYDCDCGSVKWNGENYPLLMAEYVRSNPENIFSRRYYVTADLRGEGDTEPHNLSIQIGIDSLGGSVFYIPENDVFNLFEEVNNGDELLPYRSYACTNGVINVTPAILGGTESVSFQMILRETVDGAFVGFDIPVSGSFEVDIVF